MRDGLCAICCGAESHEPGTRGYCISCGHFYDFYGRRILDITVMCKFHIPINAMCPHSGSLVD